MALLSDYTAGTVSVANGGTTVTGVGTGWSAAQFKEGDWFIANGWVNVIASVASNTSLTLTAPYQGTTLATQPYRLRYMSDGSRSSAQARELINMLGGSGNIEAFAGLTGAANKIPMFTGPGTMTTIDRPPADANGNLVALAGLTGAANTSPYFTGPGTMAVHPQTAFGRAIQGITGANGTFIRATGAGTAVAQPMVGTVSQSGGVPTGAIVERGSNANGQYVRYADGTQMCWGIAPASDITDVVAGPVFRANAARIFTFPAAFSGSPPSVGANIDKSAGGMGSNWATITANYPTLTQVQMIMLGNSAASYGYLSYDAVGRWY